ncbi:MAG TPA: hypothetical protein VIQ02_12150 [Jiangellaceae bacterium]
MTKTRRDWATIVVTGAALVRSYPYRITLRQLHYLLVSSGIGGYVNDESCYKTLSSRTAAARRAGFFPALLDQTRDIDRATSWTSPTEALETIADWYRRDRTEDQDWFVVLGGEKATLLAQLSDWFGDLGLPLVLLRGYSSQTYVDDVAEMVVTDGRPAVLIYAGDFDPSGEDILRDFLARCPHFDKVEHVAVLEPQIGSLGLVEMPGKTTDSRAAGFVARHGRLVQVEVEAIGPAMLRALYQTAIDAYWDESTYDAVIVREDAERARLRDATLGE